jgi:hypothetical protein
MAAAMSKLTREEQLLTDLSSQIDNLKDAVFSGHCDTFEDYRFMTGRLSAYVEMHERLVKFFIDEAEDDE